MNKVKSIIFAGIILLLLVIGVGCSGEISNILDGSNKIESGSTSYNLEEVIKGAWIDPNDFEYHTYFVFEGGYRKDLGYGGTLPFIPETSLYKVDGDSIICYEEGKEDEPFSVWESVKIDGDQLVAKADGEYFLLVKENYFNGKWIPDHPNQLKIGESIDASKGLFIDPKIEMYLNCMGEGGSILINEDTRTITFEYEDEEYMYKYGIIDYDHVILSNDDDQIELTRSKLIGMWVGENSDLNYKLELYFKDARIVIGNGGNDIMSLLNLTFYDTGESIVLYDYDEFIDELPYEFIDNKLIVSIDEMKFELNKATEDWTKHYTNDEGDE